MPYSPMQLAEAFIKTGEIEDALDALNQHLDQVSEDDNARRLRIEVLLRFSDADKYQTALQDIDQLDSLIADDYIMKSSLLEKQGRFDEAINTLRAGHQRFMENDRLTEQMLYLMHKYERFQEALDILKTLPSHWQWSAWCGQLRSTLGRYDVAIADYTEAIETIQSRYEIQPDSKASVMKDAGVSDAVGLTIMGTLARLLLARAEAYRITGQLNEAQQDYQSAQVLIPDDPVISFNLGIVAFLQGDRAKAIRMCSEALNASTSLRQHMLASLKQEEAIFAPLLQALSV